MSSPNPLFNNSQPQSPYTQLQLPSIQRQLCYFSTGCLAGTASLPLTFWPPKPPTISNLPSLFPRQQAPSTILKIGIRFWTFDIVRSLLQPLNLPIWITGGIGGAAGGFNEILLHSLSKRRLPDLKPLGSQSLKLFFCFGTYTFLSTHLSERVPPKPFLLCWLLGAVAGATGTAVVAGIEGVKGRRLWVGTVPKGALTIGTVIAVQVTSCAALLEALSA